MYITNELSSVFSDSAALLATGWSPAFWRLFIGIIWNVVLILVKMAILKYLFNAVVPKIFVTARPISTLDAFLLSVLIAVF